jgi:hypothetical protein
MNKKIYTPHPINNLRLGLKIANNFAVSSIDNEFLSSIIPALVVRSALPTKLKEYVQ